MEGQEATEVTVEVKQEWNVEVEAMPAGAGINEIIEAVREQCRGDSADCDVQVIESDRRRALQGRGGREQVQA